MKKRDWHGSMVLQFETLEPKRMLALLATPTLFSPDDFATNVSVSADFDWSNVSGANAYRIIVGTSRSALPTDFEPAPSESDPNIVYNRLETGFSNSDFSPPSDLMNSEQYYWTVRAGNSSNGDGSAWASSDTFLTAVAALSAPTLQDPDDGETLVPTRPDFNWTNVSGANGYRILVATSRSALPEDGEEYDPNDSRIVINQLQNGATNSSYSHSSGTALNDGQTYYWTVRAGNSSTGAGGFWADSDRFTTIPAGLPAPTLQDPDDGETLVPTRPDFNWTSVSGANSYRILVATSRSALPEDGEEPDSGDSRIVINQPVSNSSYSHTSGAALNDGQTYYWTVRAGNSSIGAGGFWADSDRFTTIPAGLPAPTLQDPDDGETLVPTRPDFNWTSVSGANSYRILVATSRSALPEDGEEYDPNDSRIVIDEPVSNSAYSHTSGTALNDGQIYYWTVRAGNSSTGAGGFWADSDRFTTIPAGLAAPILQDPDDGETLVPTRPDFDWTDVSGADSYRILVATTRSALPEGAEEFDPNDSRIVINEPVTNSLYSHTSGTALNDGQIYYWTVRAGNGGTGAGGFWADSDSFTTIPAGLAAPILQDPNDGETLVPTRPDFNWTDVTGANRYRILVATSQAALPQGDQEFDPDDSRIVINVPIEDGTSAYSHTSGTPLNDGQIYFWTVRAGNTNGAGGFWADSDSFTTIPAGLPAPILETPDDGETFVPIRPDFDWTDVTGANRYRILVATSQSALPQGAEEFDPNDSRIVINVPIDDGSSSYSHITGAPLVDGQTYFWTVRAGNTNGAGGFWADSDSFSVGETAPPAFQNPTLGGEQPSTDFTDFSKPVGEVLRFGGMVSDDTDLSITIELIGPKGSHFIHNQLPVNAASVDLNRFNVDLANETYANVAGNYEVLLTARDSFGNENSESWKFNVTEFNLPEFSNPTFNGQVPTTNFTDIRIPVGQTVSFGGVVSDDFQLQRITVDLWGPQGEFENIVNQPVSGDSVSLSQFSVNLGDNSYANVAGEYTVSMSVEDTSGNVSVVSWSFFVTEAIAPVLVSPTFGGEQPSTDFTSFNKKVGQVISFGGVAIDDTELASVSVFVKNSLGCFPVVEMFPTSDSDSVDMSLFNVDLGNVNYANMAGNFTVAFSVKDTSDNTSTAEWNFTVDPAVILPIEYDYDDLGNLASMTNELGLVTNYTHDGLGRLTQVVAPNFGEVITYTYDANSNRISMSDASGLTSYDFDALNRLTQITLPGSQGMIGYGYDLAGRITSLTYPDGTLVVNAYDLAGRLASVTQGSDVTSYTYYADGLLESETLPNGVQATYTYDDFARLTDLEYQNSSGALVTSFHYSLDSNGNRTGVEIHRANESTSDPSDFFNNAYAFQYDALNRLTDAEYPDGETVAYAYDANGNRLSTTTDPDGVGADPAVVEIYQYGSDNRLELITDVSGVTIKEFVYDARGNIVMQITPDDTTRYEFDYRNLLVGVEDASSNIRYEYNGDGQRIAEVVDGQRTNFVNDPNRPFFETLMETDQAGTTQAIYTYGIDRIAGVLPGENTPVYYLQDAQNSTSDLVAGDGLSKGSYSYDAFGSGRSLDSGGIETQLTNSYLFSGERKDEGTGFVFLRARQYDSETGRFSQKDPIGLQDGSNAYEYAESNPVNLSDPSGMFVLPFGFVAGVVAAPFVGAYALGDSIGQSIANGESGKQLAADAAHSFAKSVLGTVAAGAVSSVPFGFLASGFASEGVEYALDKRAGVDASYNVTSALVNSALSKLPVPGFKTVGFKAGSFLSNGVRVINTASPYYKNFLREAGQGIAQAFIGEEVGRTLGDYDPLSPPSWLGIGPTEPGGVLFDQAVGFVGDISEIVGATVDPVTGQVVLVGSGSDASIPELQLDDFVAAVRSVFGSAEFPGVSIDPQSGHELDPEFNQIVRMLGGTQDTDFGWVMLEADRVMKTLALGRDNVSGAPAFSNVAGYENIIQILEAAEFEFLDQWMSGWFFKPSNVELLYSEDVNQENNSFVFSDTAVQLVVNPELTSVCR